MSVQFAVQHHGRPGLLAGILGCVFGILGIFTLGFIFVPLAAVCGIIGLMRGVFGGNASGIGTSILAGVLAVFGFISSPSLWAVTAAGMLALNNWQPTERPAASITTSQPLAPGMPWQNQQLQPQQIQGSQQISQMTSQQAVQNASAEANVAMAECNKKRRNGELKTFVASTNCSNPRILAAYQRAQYPYMDLVRQLIAKRLEVSERLDTGKITEAQAQLESAQFGTYLTDIARRRDKGLQ